MDLIDGWGEPPGCGRRITGTWCLAEAAVLLLELLHARGGLGRRLLARRWRQKRIQLMDIGQVA